MKKFAISTLRSSTLALAIASCGVLATQARAEQVTSPAPAAQQQKNAWGQDAADLTPDPAIIYGVLPNGMKYAIRPNETPKGAASVRLHIGVGSIAEAENERGIAHLLEHMAFNGSKNVPEGEMVKMLERLGLAFGPDTNAVTKFDETVYMLELPKTSDELVDAALMLMRETAGELTISAAAVERERGVVLSERQTRNTPELRQAEKQLSDVMPQTPFGKRFPIGTEEVLKTVSAETIRNFYRRYYRPDNATLVLVGDFDPQTVEAKIKAKFADWAPVGSAGAPLDRGTIAQPAAPQIFNYVEPTIRVGAEFYRLRPLQKQLDSKSKRLEETKERIASSIVSKRLQNIALQKDTRIGGGYNVMLDFFNAADATILSVLGKEGDWQGAVTVAEQELRRALQHGFTQSEIDEAIANEENRLKTDVLQATSRSNGQIADAIVATLNDPAVVDSPQAKLAVFLESKAALNKAAVEGAFRAAWSGGPSHIHIATKEAITDTQATIRNVLQDSMKIAVAPLQEASSKAFAYNSFGPAGKIASDKMIADVGIRAIKFGNGVMLNIKKTDFEPGKIAFGLRVGSGERGFPADKPGMSTFLSSMAAAAALEAHDTDELRRLTAGHTIVNGLIVDDTHVGHKGTTTPADLELQMKVLAAYISAFGYRDAADTLWKNIVPGFSGQLSANPVALSQVKLPRLVAGGDGRFGLSETEELVARNMAELKPYLDPQLKSGPIEISLAGDVDEAKAIDIIARTFGALPKRAEKLVVDSSNLKIATAAPTPKPFVLTHAGKDDQAVVSVRWLTTDDSDMVSDIKRDLLADLMQLRLTEVVREELGATYSPITSSVASDAFPGFGYIAVDIVAEPQKMAVVNDAILRIAKEMTEAPVSEDLLLRARKPLIEKFDKESRENKFWQAAIDRAQSEPQRLERVRAMRKLLETISPTELNEIARQYLTSDRRRDYRIVSKAVAEAGVQ